MGNLFNRPCIYAYLLSCQMNDISIWEEETFFAPQDIIIAGGGLVGLWSAFFLKKKHRHLKIAIIERGIIPAGASTRNAGFACFGSLSEILHDIRTMGPDKTLELIELRYKGLDVIQKHFSATQIDFNRCGGYELYDKARDKVLKQEIEYINPLMKGITGSKETYRLKNNRISRFGFGKTAHLVYNKLEGCLHPGKLVQALLREAEGMGVQVLNGIEATQLQKNGKRLIIHNKQAVQLSADQVLVCTNAFSHQLLPEIGIIPARGQVIVTSPIKDLPWKGTFHSDEGFYYFRNLGKRVLLGGARNKAFAEEQTTEMQTSGTIQQHLEGYLADIILPRYKGQYRIDYRWAGIMGMGAEKMPVLKEVEPGIFCAVRMSGMGVALAPAAASKVIRLMGY